MAEGGAAQNGRVAVVTGATSGVGEALALRLAQGGWRLVLVNRSRAASGRALERLRRETPAAPEPDLVEADLADQEAVTRAAGAILALHPRIDALFSNAGVMMPGLVMSRHGNELTFQVNTLAPYMLMRLLRPALEAAGGRIVNVSSEVVLGPFTLDVEQLRRPVRYRGLMGAYAQSKLALTALSANLAPDHSADGVLLRSASPGAIDTKMTAGRGMPALFRLFHRAMNSPERGADRLNEAAFDPKFGAQAGVFIAGGRVRRPHPSTQDPHVQLRLLSLCAELTGL